MPFPPGLGSLGPRMGAVAVLPLLLASSCLFGQRHLVTRAEALQGSLRTSVELSFAAGQWDDAPSTWLVKGKRDGARYHLRHDTKIRILTFDDCP